MKKRIIIPLLISTLSLSGCCLFSHDFAEATCTTPSTCTKCGEIQGEALGHTFTDATCAEAKTCSVCNFAEGNPLEHKWLEATTENPKTCELCGLTEGEPLQGDFSQAKIDEYEVEIKTEPVVEEETGEPKELNLLNEDDYKGDDPLDAEIDSLLNASPSPDTDAAIQDTAQQIIAGYLKEHAQEQQEVVDVPGGTPYDPSQDGTTPDYSAVDVPEHLMGSFH